MNLYSFLDARKKYYALVNKYNSLAEDMAGPKSLQYDAVRVQTSRDSHDRYIDYIEKRESLEGLIAEQWLAMCEQFIELCHIINRLDNIDHKEIAQLRYMQGFSNDRTADELNISKGRIFQHLRAMQAELAGRESNLHDDS